MASRSEYAGRQEPGFFRRIRPFVVTLGDGVTWQEAQRHFEKLPAQLVNAFPDVNQKFKTVSFYNLGLLSCPSQ